MLEGVEREGKNGEKERSRSDQTKMRRKTMRRRRRRREPEGHRAAGQERRSGGAEERGPGKRTDLRCGEESATRTGGLKGYTQGKMHMHITATDYTTPVCPCGDTRYRLVGTFVSGSARQLRKKGHEKGWKGSNKQH